MDTDADESAAMVSRVLIDRPSVLSARHADLQRQDVSRVAVRVPQRVKRDSPVAF